jgi:hypothetical protein
MRMRTPIRENLSIWLQFDRYKLRLLICEFLEKKLVGFVQVASPSRLGSSEGRVEERVRLCCRRITTDVPGSGTVNTDANQKRLICNVNENYDLYNSLN